MGRGFSGMPLGYNSTHNISKREEPNKNERKKASEPMPESPTDYFQQLTQKSEKRDIGDMVQDLANGIIIKETEGFENLQLEKYSPEVLSESKAERNAYISFFLGQIYKDPGAKEAELGDLSKLDGLNWTNLSETLSSYLESLFSKKREIIDKYFNKLKQSIIQKLNLESDLTNTGIIIYDKNDPRLSFEEKAYLRFWNIHSVYAYNKFQVSTDTFHPEFKIVAGTMTQLKLSWAFAHLALKELSTKLDKHDITKEKILYTFNSAFHYASMLSWMHLDHADIIESLYKIPSLFSLSFDLNFMKDLARLSASVDGNFQIEFDIESLYNLHIGVPIKAGIGSKQAHEIEVNSIRTGCPANYAKINVGGKNITLIRYEWHRNREILENEVLSRLLT